MDAKLFSRVAVYLAVVGTCLPQLALASTVPSPVTANVQLREGGVLLGQVVTPEQTAVAHTTVSLGNQAGELARAKTDQDGHFAFEGLHEGLYRVWAANGQREFRAWSQGTAPPAAGKGLLIVSGSEVVRGKPGGGVLGFVTSPLGIALMVATAIAVPVAIHNSRSK